MKYLLLSLLFISHLSHGQSARYIYPVNDLNNVKALEFSPQNQYVAASTFRSVSLYRFPTGELLYARPGKQYAHFSRDEKVLFYRSPNVIHALDINSGVEKSWLFEGEADFKIAGAGNYILGRTSYNLMSILSTSNGEIRGKVAAEPGASVISADEKYLFTYDHQRYTRWSLPSVEIVESIDTDTPLSGIVFSRDGQTMIGYYKDSLYVYNMNKNKPKKAVIVSRKSFETIYLTNDGKSLVVISDKSLVETWDTKSWKLLNAKRLDPYISFSSRRGNFAFVRSTKSDVIFDLETNRLDSIASVEQRNGYRLYIESISNDGKWISYLDDDDIYVYSGSKNDSVKISSDTDPLVEAIVSPKQDRLLVNNEHSIALWEINEGKIIQQKDLPRASYDMRYSDDGRVIMIWDGRDFDMLDANNLSYIASYNNHRKGTIYKAFVSSDHNTVALYSGYDISIFRNNKDSELVRISDMRALNDAVLNNAGSIIYMAENKKISMYDIDKNRLLKQFEAPASDSNYKYIKLSLDENLLIASSTNDTYVWDIQSGKKLYQVPGRASITPDGKMLMAGSTFFNINTGELIETGPSHMSKYKSYFPSHRYSISYPDVLPSNKMARIKDDITGVGYDLVLINAQDYLVFDGQGHVDGTATALQRLQVACGEKVIDRSKWKQLVMPGLVKKVLNETKIKEKGLSSIECK